MAIAAAKLVGTQHRSVDKAVTAAATGVTCSVFFILRPIHGNNTGLITGAGSAFFGCGRGPTPGRSRGAPRFDNAQRALSKVEGHPRAKSGPPAASGPPLLSTYGMVTDRPPVAIPLLLSSNRPEAGRAQRAALGGGAPGATKKREQR